MPEDKRQPGRRERKPRPPGRKPPKRSGQERRRPGDTSRQRRQSRPPSRQKSPQHKKKLFYLLVNRQAGRDPELAVKLARRAERRLRRSNAECEMQIADTWDKFVQMTHDITRKRPHAVVVFGGDGSVRLAASRVARNKGLLGIVPCGRFNNIFRSLYGHADVDKALDILRSPHRKHIDAGLANGNFFLGSLITGLVPIMLKNLGADKPPRLAMTWGKMAAQAADETMPQTATMKIDAYTFQAQPLILHIHLLSDLMSLRFAPPAAPDDGRVVVLYDRDGTRDIVSHYIRDLKKQRYQYLDGIQMLRGQRVTITPATGRTWLMDGDKIEFAGEEIGIEVLHRIVRIFTDVPGKEEEK
jgi:diacylglycerol kinase (ATP)